MCKAYVQWNMLRTLTVSLSMNVQRYARIAGLLFLISLVAGGFGEAYAPSRLIVSNDAAATVATD